MFKWVQRQEEEQLITKAQYFETALHGIAKASDSTETGTSTYIFSQRLPAKEKMARLSRSWWRATSTKWENSSNHRMRRFDDNSETFNLAFPFPMMDRPIKQPGVDRTDGCSLVDTKAQHTAMTVYFNQIERNHSYFRGGRPSNGPQWGLHQSLTTTHKSKIMWSSGRYTKNISQSASQHVLLTFQICRMKMEFFISIRSKSECRKSLILSRCGQWIFRPILWSTSYVSVPM